MLSYFITTVIFAVSVSSINLYCLVVIVRSHKVKQPPHMSIFSLLLGHLLQGLITIPSYAAKKQGIYKKTAICDIFRFSYLLTNYWCCLSVLVISVDRVIGVSLTLEYKSLVTTKRMFRVLLGVWVYVFILCLIPFAPSTRKRCKYNPQKAWAITMLLGNTLLPFVAIAICYFIIIRKIKNSLGEQCNATMQQYISHSSTAKKQLKRAKTTFFIVGTYVVCWGPSLFYYILLNLCPNKCFSGSFHNSQNEEVMSFVIKTLTFVDGVVAPLVYCCTSKNFNALRRRVISSLRNKISTPSFGRRNAMKPESRSSVFDTLNRLVPLSLEDFHKIKILGRDHNVGSSTCISVVSSVTEDEPSNVEEDGRLGIPSVRSSSGTFSGDIPMKKRKSCGF